jgi:ABC-2 type transport system permease protein
VTVSTAPVVAPLAAPGKGLGLLDVLRRRFLLRLLVRKELRIRYRGSLLGLLWSYVKPAVQFTVYYFALGVFLKLNRSLENFAVYLFSGIVLITFFSEAFANASRSVVGNAPLIKKIFLPRELFPVSSLVVATIHLFPQLVVLFAGSLVTGWHPDVAAVVAAFAGFGVFGLFGLGLGLVFAAANVYYRDFENIVDLVLVVATWASPILYPWTAVRDALGNGVLLQLYLANPLTTGVSLFQRAFWAPTTTSPHALIPQLWPRAAVSLLAGALVVVLGQAVFRRLEGRFAQEL